MSHNKRKNDGDVQVRNRTHPKGKGERNGDHKGNSGSSREGQKGGGKGKAKGKNAGKWSNTGVRYPAIVFAWCSGSLMLRKAFMQALFS